MIAAFTTFISGNPLIGIMLQLLFAMTFVAVQFGMILLPNGSSTRSVDDAG